MPIYDQDKDDNITPLHQQTGMPYGARRRVRKDYEFGFSDDDMQDMGRQVNHNLRGLMKGMGFGIVGIIAINLIFLAAIVAVICIVLSLFGVI